MTEPVQLLVTTTHAAWLLDAETGLARAIDRGRGVYYGITFSAEEIFVACRQAEVGADRESQDNIILRFDRRLRCTGALRPPIPLRDVHQIAYHAGTLFACATYDDLVLRYAFDQRAWTRWLPFGADTAADRHHLNSILVRPDEILLAGTQPSGWYARVPHGSDLARPVWLGRGTHNVWLERGQVRVCSSDEGAIRSERGDIAVIEPRGWLRGYASDGHHRYVGVSQHLVRESRHRSDCMILRLDPAGRASRSFAFPGTGMLHDLRVLGVPDSSGNGLAIRLETGAAEALTDALQTAAVPISLAPATVSAAAQQG